MSEVPLFQRASVQKLLETMSTRRSDQGRDFYDDEDETLISNAKRQLFNMELVTKVCARDLISLLGRFQLGAKQAIKDTGSGRRTGASHSSRRSHKCQVRRAKSAAASSQPVSASELSAENRELRARVEQLAAREATLKQMLLDSDRVIQRLRRQSQVVSMARLKQLQEVVERSDELKQIADEIEEDIASSQTPVTTTTGTDATTRGTTADGDERPPDHIYRLDKLHSEMTSKISAHSVARLMFQSEALTLAELEAVVHSKHPSEAAEVLLKILRTKSERSVYDCLLEILKQTGQTEVYKRLVCSELIDNEHSERIRRHYMFLLDNIDPKFSGLIGALYCVDVIDRTEKDELEAEASPTRRTEKLLTFLSRKSPEQFEGFLTALEQTDQSHVAKVVREIKSDEDSGEGEEDDEELENGFMPEVDKGEPGNIENGQDKPRSVEHETKLKTNEISNNGYEASITQVVVDDGRTETTSEAIDATTPGGGLKRRNKVIRFKNVEADDDGKLTPNEADRDKLFRELLDVKLAATFPEGDSLYAIAAIEDEIYVRLASDIVVYDANVYRLKRHLAIPGLGGHNEITACSKYRCLYVVNRLGDLVHRVEKTGALSKWHVHGFAAGLSVNSAHHVLVACPALDKIKEFKTDGVPVREVHVTNPFYAEEMLGPNRLLVTQGQSPDDPIHRIALIDVSNESKILHSYGERRGSGSGQLNQPLAVAANGFVLVADRANCRLLLMTPNLRFIRQVAPRTSNGYDDLSEGDDLVGLHRMWFDKATSRLFVIDNRRGLNDGEIISGMVKVYDVC